MRAAEAGRAPLRHRRVEYEVAETLLRARLRHERRLRAFAPWREAVVYAEPEALRWLDLVHESTRTVTELEDRLENIRDTAAESAWMERAADGYLG